MTKINGNAPSGTGRSLPQMWNAEARNAWLHAHNAPANFILITVEELAILEDALIRQQKQSSQYTVKLLKLGSALGHYFVSRPTLLDAVETAIFDLGKYRLAAIQAEHALARAIEVMSNGDGITTGLDEFKVDLECVRAYLCAQVPVTSDPDKTEKEEI